MGHRILVACQVQIVLSCGSVQYCEMTADLLDYEMELGHSVRPPCVHLLTYIAGHISPSTAQLNEYS